MDKDFENPFPEDFSLENRDLYYRLKFRAKKTQERD